MPSQHLHVSLRAFAEQNPTVQDWLWHGGARRFLQLQQSTGEHRTSLTMRLTPTSVPPAQFFYLHFFLLNFQARSERVSLLWLCPEDVVGQAGKGTAPHSGPSSHAGIAAARLTNTGLLQCGHLPGGN